MQSPPNRNSTQLFNVTNLREAWQKKTEQTSVRDSLPEETAPVASNSVSVHLAHCEKEP